MLRQAQHPRSDLAVEAHDLVKEFGDTRAVNGVSLTCFNSRDGAFTVAIIPYTFEHTNFSALQKGDIVNLEFDIIGKYVQRLVSPRS